MGLIEKIKEFSIGLAVLIAIGLGWLFLLVIWSMFPEGSLTGEIAGALFLLYSLAIVIILMYTGFKGGTLESWGMGILMLIFAGLICLFLVGVWRGLLVVLLFGGVGVALTAGIWKMIERKKGLAKVKKELEDLEGQTKDQAASELGYDLLELKEQLGRGAITREEYERKKKLLEGLTELKVQLGRGDISFEEYHQKKKKLLEKIERYKQMRLGEN